MLFNEVIGQQAVKKHLQEMVARSRLSHALLFTGKEGSGALPLAIAFASYILCEKVNGKAAAGAGQGLFAEDTGKTTTKDEVLFAEDAGTAAPKDQGLFAENTGKTASAKDQALFPEDTGTAEPAPLTDSCGVCSSCRKLAELAHPDLHFTYPVIPKKAGDKPLSTDYISEWRSFIGQHPYGNAYDWLQSIGAENKQGNITAHECNEITRKLSLKSFESGYKILILWMPEYLGTEGNKLLKLIEEPPPDTLFILVSENEHLVLPTILSRTQLVRIPPVDPADVGQALQTQAKLPAAQARQLAAVSSGNYREALLLAQHTEEDWQALLREWLNAIMKSGPVAQVKWIDEISKLGREKQKQFLKYFTHLLEQALRMRVMEGHELNFPDHEKDFAARLNKMIGIEQIGAIVEELDKASYYIERNANGKMLFHALTIKLYRIIADKSLFLVT